MSLHTYRPTQTSCVASQRATMSACALLVAAAPLSLPSQPSSRHDGKAGAPHRARTAQALPCTAGAHADGRWVPRSSAPPYAMSAESFFERLSSQAPKRTVVHGALSGCACNSSAAGGYTWQPRHCALEFWLGLECRFGLEVRVRVRTRSPNPHPNPDQVRSSPSLVRRPARCSPSAGFVRSYS
eukprot:scaffold113191_cov57-Phaeocystis_antarctica.AAC.4